MKNILLILFYFSITKSTIAQIKIDSTFGSDGYFISTPSNKTFSSKILVDAKSDVFEAGAQANANYSYKIRIWKFDKNGTAVNSFGTNGVASNTNLDNVVGNISIIDLLKGDNDKLWICFQLENPVVNILDSNKYRIGIVRFNADGSVDNTFGTNGYILNRPQANFEYHPTAIVLENSLEGNSAYISAWVSESGHASCPAGFGKWCISKYANNGSLANSFNNIGYKQLSADSIKQAIALEPLSIIHDLALDANGNLLASGALHNLDRSYFNFKMKPDGSWDNSFGNNGRNLLPVNYDLPTNKITKSKILKDLSIVYSTNYTYYNGSSTFKDSIPLVIIKSDIAGKRDSTYGTLGTAFTYFISGNHFPLYNYFSDGSCLITTYCNKGANFTDQHIEFVYLKSNGLQDFNFGTNGRFISAIRTPDNYINATNLTGVCFNKTESEMYFASSHQLLATTSFSYGAIKYKWTHTSPLALNNVIKNANIEIYPNPITDNLISIKHDAKLSKIVIVNIKGQIIPAIVVAKSNNITQIKSLQNLVVGNYFIVIQSDFGAVVKQFSVK